MSDEHSYQKAFKELVQAHGGTAVSLAGSVFMAGMPDLMCVSTDGAICLIENKFWSKRTDPEDFHALQKQFHGSQVARIKHDLWKKQAPVILVTQIIRNLDTVYINYKTDVYCTPWKRLAKNVAKMPMFNSTDQFIRQVMAD